MSEWLPSVDADIQAQLTRRSSGRPPEALAAEIAAALDRAGQSRSSRLERLDLAVPWPPRLEWTAQRLAAVGLIIALVLAAVAVGNVLPNVNAGPRTTPSGAGDTPSGPQFYQPLTTADLAAVMAGPAPQANAAIVAAVTIDAKTDVCPMDRYPTVGVVEGMGSQVCVMGGSVYAFLPEAKATGVFAFRYIGPGVLGLLGQITRPDGHYFAFGAGDRWPTTRETFLVDGWLGSSPVPCPSSATDGFGIGDLLEPTTDSCLTNWLGADASATPATGASESFGVAARSRYVSAEGARHFDSIFATVPVHGIFVVRAEMGPCPGASPIDSRGCMGWKVLAKVAGIVVPAPGTAATTAPVTTIEVGPASPIAEPSSTVVPAGLIGSGGRALTATELAALIVADPNHLAGRSAVGMRVVCDGTGSCDAEARPVADLIQDDGSTVYLGPLDVRPDGTLVWTIPEALGTWQTRFFFVVEGWLGGAAEDSCDVAGQPCYEVSWLGSSSGDRQLAAQPGSYSLYGGGPVGGGPPIHGLFLVARTNNAKTCGTDTPAPSGDCAAEVQIVARLETAAVP
jgi:hypothetical protein